jgi:hypothetical protein
MVYLLDVVNSMRLYADIFELSEKFENTRKSNRLEVAGKLVEKMENFSSEVPGKLGPDLIKYLKGSDGKRYQKIIESVETAKKLIKGLESRT